MPRLVAKSFFEFAAPWAALLLILPLLAGCDASDGRQAIAGAVTLDGEPLEHAVISFRPLAHAAPSTGGYVRDGRFEIPAHQGLLPGKYQVYVQAFRETGQKFFDPQRGAEVADLAPIAFQDAGMQEVTVAEDLPNEFELNLLSER